jgi:hypothetical protein
LVEASDFRRLRHGFSSLNYVKDLPVDDLKIDKSFIDGLGEDAVNEAIVRLSVDFTHPGSQGDRRRSGERPTGGQPEGHELRPGPGYLFLEAATQRGSGLDVAQSFIEGTSFTMIDPW